MQASLAKCMHMRLQCKKTVEHAACMQVHAYAKQVRLCGALDLGQVRCAMSHDCNRVAGIQHASERNRGATASLSNTG